MKRTYKPTGGKQTKKPPKGKGKNTHILTKEDKKECRPQFLKLLLHSFKLKNGKCGYTNAANATHHITGKYLFPLFATEATHKKVGKGVVPISKEELAKINARFSMIQRPLERLQAVHFKNKLSKDWWGLKKVEIHADVDNNSRRVLTKDEKAPAKERV